MENAIYETVGTLTAFEPLTAAPMSSEVISVPRWKHLRDPTRQGGHPSVQTTGHHVAALGNRFFDVREDRRDDHERALGGWYYLRYAVFRCGAVTDTLAHVSGDVGTAHTRQNRRVRHRHRPSRPKNALFACLQQGCKTVESNAVCLDRWI